MSILVVTIVPEGAVGVAKRAWAGLEPALPGAVGPSAPQEASSAGETEAPLSATRSFDCFPVLRRRARTARLRLRLRRSSNAATSHSIWDWADRSEPCER